MNKPSTARRALTRLVAMVVTLTVGTASGAEWTLDASGDWAANGNWTNPATFPNAVDAVADFSTLNISNYRNVTIRTGITVGSLLLGDTSGSQIYKIKFATPGFFRSSHVNSLTFDVSSGNATLSNNSGGTDQFGSPALLGMIILNDTLVISGNSLDLEMRISGTGGIIYNGTGTLNMSGATTLGQYSYTGDTVVNSGIYLGSPAHNGNLAPGNLQINEAKYQGAGPAELIRPLGTGAGEFQLTGGTAAGFTYIGDLTIRFNNNNSYVVQWGSAVFDPGTLLLGRKIYGIFSNARFENILDLNGAARTVDVDLEAEWEMERPIRDTVGGATLTKTGNGALNLRAANTWTGGMIINGGPLRAMHADALTSGPVSFTGATAVLDVRANATIAALSSASGYGTVTVGTADTRSLTVSQTTNTTFSGVIESGDDGTLSLVKDGTGSLTLSGASTYTGATTLSAGTLLVNGSLNAGSAVTVSGGTLGGSGTIGGSVTVGAAGNVAPGASAGTLSIGGNLDISAPAGGAGQLDFELDALASTNDQIAVTGTLTIGVGMLGAGDFAFTDLGGVEIGTYTLISSGGITGGNSLNGSDLAGVLSGFPFELQINGGNIELVISDPIQRPTVIRIR